MSYPIGGGEGGYAIVEMIFREDEPRLTLVDLIEFLETLNAIYVGLYDNQRILKRLDTDPLYFDVKDFDDRDELHRFIGNLQEEGVLSDIRSNTRKWSPVSVEEDLRVLRIEKESPALIELAGAGVPLLIMLWFASNIEAEYSVTEQYGPDERLESRIVERRVSYNTSSLSDLSNILKRRFK